MDRPTHESKFGKVRIKIQDPSPRKGLKILAFATQVLGARLIETITDSKIDISDKVDKAMMPVVYMAPDLVLNLEDKMQLGLNIVAAMARLDPGDAEGLVEMLLLGQAKVAVDVNPDTKEPAWVELTDDQDGRDRIDAIIPDAFTLLKIARWAFVCYFRPTSAGRDTDENSSKAGEEKTTTSPPVS